MEIEREVVIEFRDVVKTFGELRALGGLNLHVRKGELYGLLGPNGAGKTTAIRVLLGLTSFDSGVCRLLGAGSPPRNVAHRAGFVPQEPALYRDLSIRQNLRLFADIFGLDRAKFEESAARVLEFVNLAERADSVVRELSGGMKRRASLAVAMVHDPEVLLLDEPTVGIDPELRATFWQEFGALKGQGKSILLTTHYLDEARRCDRVGFLRGGALVAEGPPDELMAKTSTSNLEDAFLAYLRKSKEVSA